MKTALLPLICSAALAGVALVVAGVDTYARVFTALGLPHVAVPLATDAKTRGEALFRAGDFEAADRPRRIFLDRNLLFRGGTWCESLTQRVQEVVTRHGHEQLA